jgi:hypothetical protein
VRRKRTRFRPQDFQAVGWEGGGTTTLKSGGSGAG